MSLLIYYLLRPNAFYELNLEINWVLSCIEGYKSGSHAVPNILINLSKTNELIKGNYIENILKRVNGEIWWAWLEFPLGNKASCEWEFGSNIYNFAFALKKLQKN